MNRKEQISALLTSLSSALYEKEHILSLSLLSSIAGESIFLLGPPGVAKSMIARRLKLAFRQANAFEYLMSRFSTPDELFGPVSITRMKNDDCYERVVEGYLPTADVVFLDEIWKAGPSIQNTLLSAINEKIFRNGRQILHLPLKGLIAASNELPAQGEGLEALWDRFMIRYLVQPISDAYLFDRMIADTTPDDPQVDETLQLTEQQLKEWQNEIRTISIGDEIFEYIRAVKVELAQYNMQDWKDRTPSPIYVSDRRWKKTIGLLRTSAFLNQSDHIRYTDLTLLLYCLWNEPEQIRELKDILLESLVKSIVNGIQCDALENRVSLLRDELKANHRNREFSHSGLKVIGNFYYQLKTGRRTRILIYTSEFDNLKADQPQGFILLKDKYQNDTQILKKYEKSRYPNVTAKDVYPVRRGQASIFIKDTEYPLVTEEGYVPPQETTPAMMQRSFSAQEELAEVKACYEAIRQQFDELQKSERDYCSSHLFVSEEQSILLHKALNLVSDRLFRIANDLTEITRSCELENETY